MLLQVHSWGVYIARLLYDTLRMNRGFLLTLLVGMLLVLPQVTFAIPPPDVIVQLGSQIAQIFALMMVLFSAGAGVFLQVARRGLRKFKHGGIWSVLAAFGVLMFSLSCTYVVVSIYEAKQLERYEQEVAQEIEDEIESYDIVEAGEPGAFFEANESLPLLITNEDFSRLAEAPIFVLDAREDEEYEIGYYPGSNHVRFADLLAGEWQDLPTDKVVYVLCWSGIRGQELAEFLRTKGIVSQYLEDGASGWVEWGGAWNGEILFSSKYNEKRYTGTLSTSEVHNYVDNGTILVDARRQDVFTESHIEDSLNITIFFTPSDELDKLFAQVPPGSQVITICDDYVSCFDAKIAGVKLEELGHTFLGRYNEPWAY